MLIPWSMWIRASLFLASRKGVRACPGGLFEAGRLRPSLAERQMLEEIRPLREAFLRRPDVVEVEDHGAGYARGIDAAWRGARPNRRRISSICRRAAIPHGWGAFLFLLVRRLQPRTILELGTSLGLSAAYLVRALALNAEDGVSGRLVTIEGDPTLADLAWGHLNDFSEIVRLSVGRFDDVLGSELERIGSLDWVFIDGHHEEDAAYRYFERIGPYLSPGACVVVDDLQPWATTVFRAWRRIVAEHPSWPAVNMLKLGVLFAGPEE